MNTYKEIRTVQLTPAVTAGAYSAGDIVGPLLEFTNVFTDIYKKGEILGATIVDDAGQTATYDIFFFRSIPAGTFTDNAAFGPSKADLALCSPVLQLASSNRFAAGARSVTTLSSLNSVVQSNVTTLYAVLVDRTGRTGASTTDIIINLTIGLLG